MRVILLKDVRRVGQHGEVKEVADGYAANFLFPQKLAEPATEAKINEIEARRHEHAAQLEREEEILNNKIQALRGKQVVVSARATEKGGLFKSITPRDIAKAILAEYALEVPESAIVLSEHIKTVGEHAVLLSSKTHKAELKVSVIAAL